MRRPGEGRLPAAAPAAAKGNSSVGDPGRRRAAASAFSGGIGDLQREAPGEARDSRGRSVRRRGWRSAPGRRPHGEPALAGLGQESRRGTAHRRRPRRKVHDREGVAPRTDARSGGFLGREHVGYRTLIWPRQPCRHARISDRSTSVRSRMPPVRTQAEDNRLECGMRGPDRTRALSRGRYRTACADPSSMDELVEARSPMRDTQAPRGQGVGQPRVVAVRTRPGRAGGDGHGERRIPAGAACGGPPRASNPSLRSRGSVE